MKIGIDIFLIITIIISCYLIHGLRTPGEEIAFTARPIHSHTQIFRYSEAYFVCHIGPNFQNSLIDASGCPLSLYVSIKHGLRTDEGLKTDFVSSFLVLFLYIFLNTYNIILVSQSRVCIMFSNFLASFICFAETSCTLYHIPWGSLILFTAI